MSCFVPFIPEKYFIFYLFLFLNIYFSIFFAPFHCCNYVNFPTCGIKKGVLFYSTAFFFFIREANNWAKSSTLQHFNESVVWASVCKCVFRPRRHLGLRRLIERSNELWQRQDQNVFELSEFALADGSPAGLFPLQPATNRSRHQIRRAQKAAMWPADKSESLVLTSGSRDCLCLTAVFLQIIYYWNSAKKKKWLKCSILR